MNNESPRKSRVLHSVAGWLLTSLLFFVATTIALVGPPLFIWAQGQEQNGLPGALATLLLSPLGAYSGVYATRVCLKKASLRFVFWAFSIPIIIFIVAPSFAILVYPIPGYETYGLVDAIFMASCALSVVVAYKGFSPGTQLPGNGFAKIGRSILKTLAVAVLVYIAAVILDLLGNAFVIFRDGATTNRSTVGELLQQALVSATALYAALAVACDIFENLRKRMLVVTVWLLIVSSYVVIIWTLSIEHEIGPRTPAVLQAIASFVGVTIAAIIFLRRDMWEDTL